jgi:Xaa-Pro dipeptidase
MNYNERLGHARQAMDRQGIDLLFLTPSANMSYLTGIQRERPNYGNINYPGGWVQGALIGRERGPIILAPRMVADYHLPAHTGAEVRVLPDSGDPAELVRSTLAEFGAVRRVAVENRAWAESLLGLQRLLPDADYTLASTVLAPLRMIKDEEEIALMRHAAHLADRVLDAVVPLLKVGITELEVDTQMVRLGAGGPSFTTNVFTIGPHEMREMRETTSRRPLVPGCSLSFDFGCVYEDYCSDFGRTVHVGEPSAAFRRAYDTVIAAHDAAIVAMKSGAVTAEEANAIARRVVEEAGYGEYFRHRLGHGIGMDVHEGPFLTPGDTTPLQTGMAFTVEPSIYHIGQIGARIEDVVIVRPGGGENLNGSSSALRVIG